MSKIHSAHQVSSDCWASAGAIFGEVREDDDDEDEEQEEDDEDDEDDDEEDDDDEQEGYSE